MASIIPFIDVAEVGVHQSVGPSAGGLVCVQCTHGDHAPAAAYCCRCGGVLASSGAAVIDPDEALPSPSGGLSAASQDRSSLHAIPPAVSRLLQSLSGVARDQLDFSVRLWDQAPLVFEKNRAAKHTAKLMAGFYTELAKIEKNYATSLQKLCTAPDYGAAIEAQETRAPMASTLVKAWNAIKAELLVRSRTHSTFGDSVTTRVALPLEELRKQLSWKKDKLEQAVNDAHDLLKKTTETHAKLKAKHEKQATEYNLRGAQSKLTQHDVHLAFENQSMAEMQAFQARNAYNRAISENLSSIQVLELDRLLTTRRILLQHRLAQSDADRKYLAGEPDAYAAVQTIDALAEVTSWVEAHHSRTPCPWVMPKGPGGASASIPSPAAGRPSDASNPFGAASSTPAHKGVPIGAAVHAGRGSKHEDAVTAAAKGKRDARGATKLAAGGSSPLLASLKTAPSSAAAALPPPLTLQDLPFPVFGAPSKLEKPAGHLAEHQQQQQQQQQWFPSVASLFPGQEEAALPDISGLALAAKEYNRLCYEQLLLSTHLLADLEKVEHVDTIVNVVRVHLQITQGEHDLLISVLKIDQGILINSPTPDETQRRRLSSGARPSLDGSSTRPHVSDSMSFVQYRLSLAQHTKSNRFPNLALYASWFQRQVHAVWIAILWTMEAQLKEGGPGKSAPTTISFPQFKQALQLVQLIAFHLTSKIATKLFTHGESVADHHPDMLAYFDDLAGLLSRFPPPHTSVVASTSLHYPEPMLQRVYAHLLLMACMKGADETGRPEKREERSEDEDDEDDDDEEEEETLSLNESYLDVLAALSRSRHQWKVTEFQHQSALLQLVMHIAYYQAELFDGRLLDADGFLSAEGDDSLLPLLTNIAQALSTATLVPASSPSASPAGRRSIDRSSAPSSSSSAPTLSPSELRLLAYVLRQLSTALMDFHRFPAGAVAPLVAFYQRLSKWIGIQDATERVEALMQISATQFYQTIIPTESMLAAKASAQIALQPKKMQTWTSEEWKLYTKNIAGFVRDQVEEFAPAFEKAKVDGAGQKLAEICIVQILHCVQHDVQTLLADRVRDKTGMDDTLVALVSALVRIQTVVMDTEYSEFWTSGAVKHSVSTAFPNLQDLCAGAMTRWLDVQKSKVEGIRDRCVALDDWKPLDADSGDKYSHSVKDLFNFLHTLHEGFWSHARNLHGFGISDSLQVFIDLFDVTLIQYGAQIVGSAGLDVIPAILPTKDVKLKQAKEAPDSKDKAKAFVKGLFKKEEKKAPATPSGKDDEDGPVATDIPRTGLAAQSIQSLCVRLCCIEAAVENSSDLSHALRTQIQSFIDEFPMVAPSASGAPRRLSSDKLALEAQVRAEKRWSLWQGYFHPPQRMPKADATNVFYKSIGELRGQIDHLAVGIGVLKVYVDWRSSWLTKLYAPMPLESTRVVRGELEARVEESMPTVHQCLTRTLFPIVAKQIFCQLLTAIQYVLLYGRRSIQEEQVRTIVVGDIGSLITTFEKIVPAGEMAVATKEVEQLCQVMEIPTDDLIQMYTSQKAPLPLPIMARIIAGRSGKHAQKLCIAIRAQMEGNK